MSSDPGPLAYSCLCRKALVCQIVVNSFSRRPSYLDQEAPALVVQWGVAARCSAQDGLKRACLTAPATPSDCPVPYVVYSFIELSYHRVSVKAVGASLPPYAVLNIPSSAADLYRSSSQNAHLQVAVCCSVVRAPD